MLLCKLIVSEAKKDVYNTVALIVGYPHSGVISYPHSAASIKVVSKLVLKVNEL